MMKISYQQIVNPKKTGDKQSTSNYTEFGTKKKKKKNNQIRANGHDITRT